MWLLLPLLAFSLIFLFVRHVHSYWRRKGFPSERPSLSWGFLKDVYRREFRCVDAISDAYQKGHDRLYGIYFFFRPVLLVCNLELARSIMEQSGGHFGECKWDYVKGFRRFNLLEKLAPMFSSNRLPGIFNNAQHVANHMIQHLKDIGGEQGQMEIDLQRLFRIYAVNIIGNLIYGLDINNFEQPDHVLNSYVDHSSAQSFTEQYVPLKSSVTYRLLDIIRRNVETREEGGILREDILQLLVLFRNGNDLNGNNWLVHSAAEDDKIISIPRLAKVAEDFLHSALDSVASTITFTLYELAKQPNFLDKLQEEVKCLNMVNGHMRFEDLNDVRYMDMCLRETLRMYPPVPIIERLCRKTFKLPNTKFSIDEGKTLMVPLLAIQRDQKYFPNPLYYKPMRCLYDKPEHCRSALMGFGIGSAQCVAQNFAKMVIKLALVKLLHNYRLELDANCYVKVSHLPAPIITSRHGLKMQLKAIGI